MERKLSSVQVITDITPILNADRIECLQVLGWTCVARKGEFQKGDKVIYCEIDSLIPRQPWSDSLFKDNKQTVRIKTEKLRGQLSQGLVLPISILPKGNYEPGDEVTTQLGITKYEPVIPAQLSGLVEGLFPTNLFPKTDEIRVQSIPEVLNEINNKEVYITTKINGTSMTVYYNEKFGVCSRNLELTESIDNSLWKTATELGLKEKLTALGTTPFGNYAIQGELAGPGIAKNPLNLKKLTFYVFNVYDISNRYYLNWGELSRFCSMLQLQTVPLEEVTIAKDWTIESLLERSRGLYEGTNNQKEGIVIRPTVEMYSNTLKGRLSFKVVSNEYLAKGGN